MDVQQRSVAKSVFDVGGLTDSTLSNNTTTDTGRETFGGAGLYNAAFATATGTHNVFDANGKLIRVRSQDIRAVGRATQGVRLIQLDEDDKVTAATLVEPEAKTEEDEPLTPPTVH